jgi:hypothetical protein
LPAEATDLSCAIAEKSLVKADAEIDAAAAVVAVPPAVVVEAFVDDELHAASPMTAPMAMTASAVRLNEPFICSPP